MEWFVVVPVWKVILNGKPDATCSALDEIISDNTDEKYRKSATPFKNYFHIFKCMQNWGPEKNFLTPEQGQRMIKIQILYASLFYF